MSEDLGKLTGLSFKVVEQISGDPVVAVKVLVYDDNGIVVGFGYSNQEGKVEIAL